MVPRDPEHRYVAKRDPDTGEPIKFDSLCKPCRREAQRMLYWTNPTHRQRAIDGSAKRLRETLADDCRAAEYRARHRAWNRVYRERRRRGEATSTRRSTRGNASTFPSLPAAPFVHYLARHFDGGNWKAAAGEATGIAKRTIYAWWEGERDRVAFDMLDTALVSLGLMWWEVYDPADAPELYSPLEWIDVIDEAARAFEGEGVVGAR